MCVRRGAGCDVGQSIAFLCKAPVQGQGGGGIIGYSGLRLGNSTNWQHIRVEHVPALIETNTQCCFVEMLK